MESLRPGYLQTDRWHTTPEYFLELDRGEGGFRASARAGRASVAVRVHRWLGPRQIPPPCPRMLRRPAPNLAARNRLLTARQSPAMSPQSEVSRSVSAKVSVITGWEVRRHAV